MKTQTETKVFLDRGFHVMDVSSLLKAGQTDIDINRD